MHNSLSANPWNLSKGLHNGAPPYNPSFDHCASYCITIVCWNHYCRKRKRISGEFPSCADVVLQVDTSSNQIDMSSHIMLWQSNISISQVAESSGDETKRHLNQRRIAKVKKIERAWWNWNICQDAFNKKSCVSQNGVPDGYTFLAGDNTRPRWSLACKYTCWREGK
jgi:hypothetical protein